jgi:hypothetical protein
VVTLQLLCTLYHVYAVHIYYYNTGCFYEEVRDFSDPAVGWDGIINQLVSSATETENTNDMLMGKFYYCYYCYNYYYCYHSIQLVSSATETENFNDMLMGT